MSGRRLLAGLGLAAVLGLVALLASTGGRAGGASGDERSPSEEGSDAASATGATAVTSTSPDSPSPALAERTLGRYERFRSGSDGHRLALGGTELSALARYALGGLFPQGVLEPTVRLEGGRIAAEARVVVEDFPTLPRLAAVDALLPDTVRVGVVGWLGPFDERSLAFTVDRIAVSGVPLPGAVVPEVLAALGREPAPGLPEDALAVPKPSGLLAVVVQRDSLVLVGETPRNGARVAEESG